MAANFPSSLPGLNSSQHWADGTTVIEASLLNQIQLEIDALGTKVGVDSSAVTTSHDYMLAHQGIKQRVVSEDATTDTGSTQIPFDDTVPQNTEGHEFLTCSITPTKSSNILEIEVEFWWGVGATTTIIGAIFQDSTASALAACPDYPSGGAMQLFRMRHRMTAGTTSNTTFKFRAGQNAAHTITMNGISGSRKLGGVCVSRMVITEIKV